MEYPLQLTFKLMAIARQITVRDARDQLAFYVKQKAFKLKESVTVFADEQQSRPLYTINAEKVLDISARYNFADATGRYLGSVKRHGMRSLWRAHSDILDGDQLAMTITEENAWTKFIDAAVGEIPVIGIFTGYLFHPAYLLNRPAAPGAPPALRLAKQPAFFEGKFTLEKQAQLDPTEETRALLALIMMILLERARG